jgi:hypothetical protein
MERTYAEKNMLNNIPTGVEIIHNNHLKNQIMIEIPNTDYQIHGLCTKKLWEISIINPIKGSKRKIFKGINKRTFGKFIAIILANPNQEEFKKKLTINKLKDHYKSIIKGFKA